jgi:imidazolonepropionase-like amidohydrolase
MYAVRAAACFDGTSFRDGATVLVEGEEIVAVEPLAHDVPDGVEVTTYDGTLLPGLFDCHVHLVSDGEVGSLERAGTRTDLELDEVIAASLAAQARGGVTTVRDLGDAGYRTLVARDRRTLGEPRIVAAGPPLTEPDGHCHFLGGAVHGVDAVRAAVREHAQRGVAVIKVLASGGMLTTGSDLVGVQFTPAELRVAVEAAHSVGLRVLAHCHSEAGARHAVAAGVDGLEHATLITEAGVAEPADLIEEIARRGVTVDPTLGTDPARVPPSDRLPPHLRAVVDRIGLTPTQVMERRAGQVALLHEAGVRLVSGLDAGAGPPKPHGDVWRGVVQLRAWGYSASEALTTATSVAAEDCGLGGTTGQLAAGYAADLLVVDGDLSSGLEALSRPVDVRVRGTRVPLG